MSVKLRAQAIDRFIKGLKEDGIYDDLKAACVMAGWDSLAGALTPLVGSAPTNTGLSTYDRGIGITGDGTNYINSNRAQNADGSGDQHCSVFLSDADARQNGTYIGGRDASNVGTQIVKDTSLYFASYGVVQDAGDASTLRGFHGVSRPSSSSFDFRYDGSSASKSGTSLTGTTNDFYIFSRSYGALLSSATIAFYSIGSATDIALLDARVSTLMADLRAIEEIGFDRDALTYIRAVEAADGAYLETSVKTAINNLVSGLKSDGLWDAIGSSCLLCGPRTLAGALVPLRGDAPTANGFVEGDYFRDTGLKGDGTSYLDSNRANDADPQDDFHASAYASAGESGTKYFIGSQHAASSFKGVGYAVWSKSASATAGGAPSSVGLYAVSRSSGSAIQYIKPPSAATSASISSVGSGQYATNDYVFALSLSSGSASNITTATLAFYSLGTAIDLAKLDTHVSAYVTAIGAAL